MKKKLTFLALSMVILGSFSCRKHVTQVTEVTEVINPSIGLRFTVKAASWKTDDENTSYYVTLPVPELDDTIYDHGAVLVYVSFGTNYFEALPEVFDGLAYGFIHNTGNITVDYHALDGGSVGAPQGDTDFKVVLVPAQAMKAHPEVNLRNFSEVQRTFLNP